MEINHHPTMTSSPCQWWSIHELQAAYFALPGWLVVHKGHAPHPGGWMHCPLWCCLFIGSGKKARPWIACWRQSPSICQPTKQRRPWGFCAVSTYGGLGQEAPPEPSDLCTGSGFTVSPAAVDNLTPKKGWACSWGYSCPKKEAQKGHSWFICIKGGLWCCGVRTLVVPPSVKNVSKIWASWHIHLEKADELGGQSSLSVTGRKYHHNQHNNCLEMSGCINGCFGGVETAFLPLHHPFPPTRPKFTNARTKRSLCEKQLHNCNCPYVH